MVRRTALTVAMAAMAVVGIATPAPAAVPLTKVLEDPFTNADSQHQTAVEPDTFAFGSTIVARVADRPLLRRRGVRHRLRDLAERRSELDVRRAARPDHEPDARRALRAHHRPGHRLRRRARRLAGAVARPRQQSDRPWRSWSTAPPTAGSPGANPVSARRRRGPGLRQELDRLRQHADQPLLRQLLHRVGRLRQRQPHPDEHLDRRRADLGRGQGTGEQRDRPRRPAGRAAERHRDRARSANASRPRSSPSAPPTAARTGAAR